MLLLRFAPAVLRDFRSTLPRASCRRNPAPAPQSTPIRTYIAPRPSPSVAAEESGSSSARNTLQNPPPPSLGTSIRMHPVWGIILDNHASGGKSGSTPMQPMPPMSPEAMWKANHDTFMATMGRVNDAYSGRSVPVLKGDLDQAYRHLEARLVKNRVRAEVRYQERHEKKGEKRNRLKSQRWRRLFAHEVRKKVQLVDAIRRRGS